MTTGEDREGLGRFDEAVEAGSKVPGRYRATPEAGHRGRPHVLH